MQYVFRYMLGTANGLSYIGNKFGSFFCNVESGKHVVGTESSVLPNRRHSNFQQNVAPFPRHNLMPSPLRTSFSCAGQLQLPYRSSL